jgi:hypothetical protein
MEEPEQPEDDDNDVEFFSCFVLFVFGVDDGSCLFLGVRLCVM